MYGIRYLAALVALLPALVAGQARINTPTSLVTCQPAQVTWEGGEAPFYVSILPGGQSGGTPLKQFPETDSSSMSWTVDIAADTAITFEIRDGSGAVNYSDQVTIRDGPDSDCTTASGASAGASSTGSASDSESTGSSADSSDSASASDDSADATTASDSAESSEASADSAEESGDDEGSAMTVVPGALAGVAGVAAALFVAA